MRATCYLLAVARDLWSRSPSLVCSIAYFSHDYRVVAYLITCLITLQVKHIFMLNTVQVDFTLLSFNLYVQL